MALSINSNILSNRARRFIDQSTNALSRAFERLSSGQRINRASDDAAGLSIASSLNAKVRIYSQARRNLNDTVSALNIADSATESLSNILTRLQELASAASTGTIARAQRLSLDREALELQREYNRIVQTTQFNGLKLIDGTNINNSTQLGIGSDAYLSFQVGNSLSRQRGIGTYTDTWSQGSAGVGATPVTGDFNNDGKQDFIAKSSLYIGNGDGTFTQGNSTGDAVYAADFNNDGNLDIITDDSVGGRYLSLGDGQGNFNIVQGYSASNSETFVDYNQDGFLDRITYSSGSLLAYSNTKNGTFSTTATTIATGLSTINRIKSGDVNGDGKQDIVVTGGPLQRSLQVMLANSSGGFTQGNTRTISSGIITDFAVSDLNNDALADIVLSGIGIGTAVSITAENGTLGSFTTISSNVASKISIADLNGDGNVDILNSFGGSGILSNGDGTFNQNLYPNYSGDEGAAYADFNGDGVLDNVISDTYSGILVSLSNTVSTGDILRFNIASVANARNTITFLSNLQNKLALERGSIGSVMSRLEAANGAIGATILNYDTARSRIVDADVASESAELTRQQILLQASSAVLSQANQAPALAIQLLR